jgi:hypothetical protein
MLIKNEKNKQIAMDLKAQSIFVHTLVNAIFTYMLSMKDKKQTINNKIGVLAHIKAYYGCYETSKNGSLHMYSLLWLNDSSYPNTLVQMLFNNEGFQKHMINYLNNIITRSIKQ